MKASSTECRKFSPNIFNRTKCQNCFRGKDAHSTEALESNRATRKVTRCGYLFVAPDWDFSLPANRNKRWQRRWFVLYDDGELAYSVDEHPETVPQAVVDMTLVLEVCDAEGVTGNPFALALTAPDKVTFVKGTSREETAKWLEVLQKFPRNTVCGKYRRNATFPCILKPKTQVCRPAPFDPGDMPTRDTQEKKKQENLSTIQNGNNCISSSRPDELLRAEGKKSELQMAAAEGGCKARPGPKSMPNALLREDKNNLSQVRGDPDGCNPDPPSATCCFSDNAAAAEGCLKKGWLVRQQEGNRWSKQWFVLRNCALTFFADPLAEEAGVLDGFIDLRRATRVQQVDSARGFTFCITMQDGSEVLLSAVTAKIRSQWLVALSAPPPSPPLARTAISRVKARSRRRSSAPLVELHKGDVKSKVEEASWSIWLEVAKLCRQVEPPEGEVELARVEERLARVQAELERARTALGIPHDQPPLATPPPSTPSSRGGGAGGGWRAEVRAAQTAADELELQCVGLVQAREHAERLHHSQMALMAARVEDLTAKLLASERQVRQLRQRCAKLEQRRRSSLKGKEALTLSKEYEAKLLELEAKVAALVGGRGEVEEGGGLLVRLAALDRRAQEAATHDQEQQLQPPKIRLQVGEEGEWNSLSLSTSMTDLTSSDETVLEGLGHQVAALVEWLRRRRSSLPPPLAAALEDPPEDGGAIYNLSLLLEVARHMHWMADQDAYRQCFLEHHLRRVERGLEGLELYLQPQGGMTLCEVAGRLLLPPPARSSDEAPSSAALLEGRLGSVAAALSTHRALVLERLSAALRELGEEGGAHKHFLALVARVVAQVAHTFEALVDRCYREVSWRPVLCGAVQRALCALSGEVGAVPGAALFLPSSARCAVLHEYLCCALADLARLVALASLAHAHLDLLHTSPPPQLVVDTEQVRRDAKDLLGRVVECGGGVWLCDERSELSVAHRSVAGLLCFKRRHPCRCCRELRQEVSYLQGELEESRVVARTGALCEKCRTLKEQIAELRDAKEKELSEEMQNMEKELQSAKNNLKRMERHYEEEIASLQREVRLQQKSEDIKLRYAEEMEQLKGVCERGLSALDASHRRMLCELEQRHQRELEELAADRERALAQEANATALALEAVRKAHSEELQKQIQNFKDEFVVKMNKRFETEAFKKCYESDLSGIKHEIVCMSEKYSAKCLENATLHQRLEAVQQQLTQLQRFGCTNLGRSDDE